MMKIRWDEVKLQCRDQTNFPITARHCNRNKLKKKEYQNVPYVQDFAAKANTTNQAIPFSKKNINAPIPARLSHNFDFFSFISDINIYKLFFNCACGKNISKLREGLISSFYSTFVISGILSMLI